MRKLTSLLSLLLAVVVNAQQITPDEAEAIASEFLNSSSTSVVKRVGVKRAKAASDSDEASASPFYVFNADENQGFVIIAGDKRAKKILGYSDTGNFDFANLPPQLALLLAKYVERVDSFPDTGEPDPSWNMHVRVSSNNEGKLLETANWGQGYPYNAQCPVVDQNKCLTGCVATAMAIIMKYHNWPNQGQGSVSYQWEGHQLNASFDSSVYDWSKMQDEYNHDGQYSNDEIYEIAHLLHDVGFSIKANYGINATYASDVDACIALGDNFRFHPGLGSISLFYCNWEYFLSVVKSEIDNDRPLLFSSLKTPNGADPHSYVGDGYDAQGYVHFNWGWEGYANGYYSIDPIKGIFGPDFYCNYGIAPTNLPRPQILDGPMVGSCGNFSYWTDGLIHCTYSPRYYYTINSPKVTGGYIVKNNMTGEEIYCECCDLSPSPLNMGGFFIQDVKMNLTIQLPDGEYIIYPAYQESGREWQRCLVSDLYQSSIRLKVLDSKKIFYNNPPNNSTPSQGVEVDGIYYNLDYESMTAEVTFRNELYNSYYGDITIPSHISFNDKEFRVNSIGDYAFRECHTLGNIILPPTIESIGGGSFMDVCYKYINLSELDNLTTIKPGAFYFNWTSAGSSKEYCRPISLPKNLRNIGKSAFMYVNFGLLEIPESVTKIDAEGLARNNIDAIKFTRTDLSDVLFSETAFNDGNHYNPSTFPILLFPENVMEDYLALDAFKKYDIVKGYKDKIIQAEKFDIYYKGAVLPEDTVIYANPLETIEFESLFFPENPTIEEITWYVKENDDHELSDYASHDIPLEDGVYKYQIWHYNSTSIDDQYTGFDHQVICMTRDGSELKRRFTIRVYADIKTITINQQEIELQIGESNKLDFSVYPANVNTELISWSCLNPEIATVDQFGNVTAIAVGTTIVKVTAASGVYAQCIVNVVGIPASEIVLNTKATELRVGESVALSATILPENVTDKTVLWTSSDEAVATIDSDGKITAVAVGEAVIKATAADGSGVSASCLVNVTMPQRGDSNANGTINIADAVNTANFAVGNYVERFYFDAADVNFDGEVTVADASGTITIILSQPVAENRMKAPSTSEQADCLVVDDYYALADNTACIDVRLDNSIDYVALQADFILPDGVKIQSVTKGDRAAGHSLTMRQIDDRRVRVALFDLGNSSFLCNNEPLIKMNVMIEQANTGDIAVENIIASDAKANEYRLNSTGGRNAGMTGIDGISLENIKVTVENGDIKIYNAENEVAAIYDIDGHPLTIFIVKNNVESYSTAPGVYIVTVGDRVVKIVVK